MADPISLCHIVAMPYPGRGHINPMLNICQLILKSRPQIITITFIVTEEWLGILEGSRPSMMIPNLRFVTIPNVIPSEIDRAKDFPGFIEAIHTKMEAPVEQLLDRLPQPKPSIIIYDTYLSWMVSLGDRKKIPVASFYSLPATFFSICYHWDLIFQNRHLTSSDDSSEKAEGQLINCIPGVPSLRFEELPTSSTDEGKKVISRGIQAIKLASKAQYILFSSLYELEPQVLENLKQSIPFIPIYSFGLAIPYFDIDQIHKTPMNEKSDYMKWLDAQPTNSVLYIAQGSFLSVPKAQLDEIIAGVLISGVRFLLVGRGEAGLLQGQGNMKGIVVPWCDQLKVLCHLSVGGFWTHCGWNSTKEGAFSGVPMLTFPIFGDQPTNSRLIVKEWKIGLRVKKEDGVVVKRDEIAGFVRRVMDLESDEGKAMRSQAEEIRNICRQASAEGGSAENEIDAFVRRILRSNIDHSG